MNPGRGDRPVPAVGTGLGQSRPQRRFSVPARRAPRGPAPGVGAPQPPPHPTRGVSYPEAGGELRLQSRGCTRCLSLSGLAASTGAPPACLPGPPTEAGRARPPRERSGEVLPASPETECGRPRTGSAPGAELPTGHIRPRPLATAKGTEATCHLSCTPPPPPPGPAPGARGRGLDLDGAGPGKARLFPPRPPQHRCDPSRTGSQTRPVAPPWWHSRPGLGVRGAERPEEWRCGAPGTVLFPGAGQPESMQPLLGPFFPVYFPVWHFSTSSSPLDNAGLCYYRSSLLATPV